MAWREKLWGPMHYGSINAAGEEPQTIRSFVRQTGFQRLFGTNARINIGNVLKPGKLRFENVPAHDRQWHVRRVLGAGGQGAAALWEKIDDDGKIIDEVVFKYEAFKSSQHNNKNIPTEVCAYMNTNPRHNDAIIYLRKFKMILNPRDPSNRSHRYFFEHGKYGDLESLALKYKAWAMHLPEDFLWHVFKALIEALTDLQKPLSISFDNMKTPPADSRAFISHRDIKPQNIFLGQEPTSPEDGQYLPDYPMPKLADFGLATQIIPGSKRAKTIYNRAGTVPYAAPEQKQAQHPSIEGLFLWNNNPLEDDSEIEDYDEKIMKELPPSKKPVAERWNASARKFYNREISHQTDVYGCGIVMLRLVTLAEWEVWQDKLAKMTEPNYNDNGQHWIPPDSPRTQKHGGDYTDQLRSLIRSCLHYDPRRRPTPDDILPIINDRISKIKLGGNTAESPIERLYHKDNDLNSRLSGPDTYLHSNDAKKFWRRFQNSNLLRDPTIGPLVPPALNAAAVRGMFESRIFRDPANDHISVIQPGEPAVPQLRPEYLESISRNQAEQRASHAMQVQHHRRPADPAVRQENDVNPMDLDGMRHDGLGFARRAAPLPGAIPVAAVGGRHRAGRVQMIPNPAVPLPPVGISPAEVDPTAGLAAYVAPRPFDALRPPGNPNRRQQRVEDRNQVRTQRRNAAMPRSLQSALLRSFPLRSQQQATNRGTNLQQERNQPIEQDRQSRAQLGRTENGTLMRAEQIRELELSSRTGRRIKHEHNRAFQLQQNSIRKANRRLTREQERLEKMRAAQ